MPTLLVSHAHSANIVSTQISSILLNSHLHHNLFYPIAWVDQRKPLDDNLRLLVTHELIL